MAFTYSFPVGTNCTRIVGQGKTTMADCSAVLKRVLADPRCQPESAALIDIRNAIYTGTAMEILELANSMESMAFQFKGNIAIVAKGATLFAAELLAAHVRAMENVKIRVFVNMAAAETFAGC